MNPDVIRSMFLDEARFVWNGSPLIDQISVKVEFSDKVSSMALSVDRRHQRAFDRHLIQCPREFTLFIGSRAKSYDIERFRATLRHEALHIGYPNHNDDFFRIAEEVGATLTQDHASGKGYQVQVQYSGGQRFQTLKTFKTMQEAEDFRNDFRSKSTKQFRATRIRF